MKSEKIKEFLTKLGQDKIFKIEVLKLNKEMAEKKISKQDAQKVVYEILLPKFKKDLDFEFVDEDLVAFFNSMELSNLVELLPKELGTVSGGVNPCLVLGVLGSILTDGYQFVRNRQVTDQHAASVSSQQMVEEFECQIFDNAGYFARPNFTKAQNEVFNITRQAHSANKGRTSMREYVQSVSSWRRDDGQPLRDDKRTELEKKLDDAVKNGDLPIKPVAFGRLAEMSSGVQTDGESSVGPKFIYYVGQDAYLLSDLVSNGAIVQLASQGNGMESVSNSFSPVYNWPGDMTQGPRGSLMALTAAKHRESAYLQDKLPDAIKDMLPGCMVIDGKGRQMSITEKYPTLYVGGYLQPWTVTDIQDLKSLSEWIAAHINDMNILAQWVRAEANGKEMLQVFNFAPSFQSCNVPWDSFTGEKQELLEKICKDIVVAQYKSLAYIAKIKYGETKEPQDLHITAVGQGAFDNPQSIMVGALKAIKEELQKIPVTVYLHQFKDTGVTWKNHAKSTDIELVDKNNIEVDLSNVQETRNAGHWAS